MLIIGAKGHAKEVLEIIMQKEHDTIAFYDDVTPEVDKDPFFNNYKILRNSYEMAQWFSHKSPEFLLGVGGIKARHFLWEIAIKNGGRPVSIEAPNASIASDLSAKEGLNVMQMAFISNCVQIGKSVLINARANIHHDVTISDFCEIGPGALILGRCQIGTHTFIGAGATILPDVVIGNYCTVGAGSVVTRNIENNVVVKGNPAK